MSDGNFNRSLLPHTPYASGLKAGKGIARKCAVDVFEAWLKEEQPSRSPEEVKAKVAHFAGLLSRALG